MQQVADWLEKLGLGQYAQRFAENDIDFSVLGYLTDQALEKVGVLLGHRRKMLAAIAQLAAATAAALEPATRTEPKPQDAERRQVTVILRPRGFTGIASTLHAEKGRYLVGIYRRS